MSSLPHISSVTMDPRHKDLLRKHRLHLSDQLLIGDTIVHFLYQENILSEDQVEEVQSQTTNRKRTLRLLDILPSRGPRAFDLFLRSLEEEFVWIKDQLLRDLECHAHEEGLTNDWRLPEEVLLAVPSDRQLSRLASRLGPEWQSIVLDLGVSAGALYRCQADHPLDAHGQALAGLVQWRRSQGRSATVARLLPSLRAADVHPSTVKEVFR